MSDCFLSEDEGSPFPFFGNSFPLFIHNVDGSIFDSIVAAGAQRYGNVLPLLEKFGSKYGE